MATLVTLSATYDQNLIYYPSGKTVTIRTDSEILGTKTLPLEEIIPGTTGGQLTADLLHIKSADLGDLYLNLTLAEYNDLIRDASLSPPITENLTLTVPGDTPTGVTVTNTALYNGVLIKVTKNGIGLDIRTMTLANVGLNGVLTLGAGDALADTDVIEIVYYTS